jgi:hypothetical protein
MSFNELNSVEHYIIQKLSGVNLNSEAGGVGAGPQAKFEQKMIGGIEG